MDILQGWKISTNQNNDDLHGGISIVDVDSHANVVRAKLGSGWDVILVVDGYGGAE